METLIALGVTFLFLGLLVGFLLFYGKWFPVSANEFRISEKKKGRVVFYRPEVKRPFWGWTGFWASSSTGSIMVDRSWTSYKNSVADQIETYKNLKNL